MRGTAEVAVHGVGRLGEHRVAVEGRIESIRTERIRHRVRVGGWRHSLGRQRLHPLGVIEDLVELGAVLCELRVAQLDARQLGDFGDIDVNRHRAGRLVVGNCGLFLTTDQCPSHDVVRNSYIVS